MDYINKFETYLSKEKRVSNATLSAYMSDIQEYQYWLESRNRLIEKAHHEDVESYMEKLTKEGKSVSTQNRKLASIKSFYGFMRNAGRMNFNPADGVKTHRVERTEIEFLTIEEVELLLNAPDDTEKGLRDKALLEMMYATGLRASEICELKVKDVDLRIGYVNVSGNGKGRIVPLGKMARTAISNYLNSSRSMLLGKKEDKNVLFLSYLGEKLTRQGVWKILKFYGDKVGLEGKLSPQILRHSFAAHLIQNGADLKSLQELLGHEDIMATKIYLSVSRNRIMDVYDKAFPRA